MQIHLAIVESCEWPTCVVRKIGSDEPIEAVVSSPMQRIWSYPARPVDRVRPGDLVMVNFDREPPQIVYRWWRAAVTAVHGDHVGISPMVWGGEGIASVPTALGFAPVVGDIVFLMDAIDGGPVVVAVAMNGEPAHPERFVEPYYQIRERIFRDKPATREDINVSLVSRLVTEQFPQWTDLPIRPVEFGGWDNKTFHLGDEMTVRLPSAEGYAGQGVKEQRWLPRLAPLLPLPIPVPLAMGVPAEGFPWHWSVYPWLEGEIATIGRIDDLTQFASTLARFLAALQQIDPAGGPVPGQHSFFRGGPLETYDPQTRETIAALHGRIHTDKVTAVWEAALNATWHSPPVWFHGDVFATNLLVREGHLGAVIDFGCSGVGDPACDLTIAWTFFSGESREAFRAALPVGRATWARGRGWALWKALITLLRHMDTNPSEAGRARRVIDEVLSDHERGG
jgi:aminoglycoside phosphotransferase (APT) family kinase protein